MALFPCSFGHHRYRGKAQHVYPTVLVGTAAKRRHLRICGPHAEQLERRLAPHHVELGAPDYQLFPQNALCVACGGVIGDDHATVFVTAYWDEDERDDYWAQLCATCDLPAAWGAEEPATVS